MLAGFGGHLVSEGFLEQRLAERPAEEPNQRVRSELRRWRERQQLMGPASSLRTLLEAGAAPLARLLGFEVVDGVDVGEDVANASLRGPSSMVALTVAPWAERLDRLWRPAVVEASRRGASWCVLFNGTHVRLIHATRVFSRRFVEFDLDCAVDDDRTTRAMWMVLSADALGTASRMAPNGSPIGIDAIVDASERHAFAVCRSLRDGVLEASEHVLRALVAKPGAERVSDVFEQSLTIVYRMLFLFFAEARSLVPLWHPVYRSSYSLETLRDVAVRRSSAGLWDALRAVARLAHAGCRAGDLRVTAFNGRLFAPSRTPLAERRDLDDELARRSLIALSTRPSPDREGREPIAYRDLGVEQLGAVYETLLDYVPSVERHRSSTRRMEVVVTLTPGSGVRKATGTFYTPQSIATYLIRRSLGPLVRDATPEQILDLRVLDPSMGSGAFLVGACTYLADAYETALLRCGRCHTSDIGADERAIIRRRVAERCLYGVDLNPMAVQLARLSLWLATLAADRPLSFLDHHLQVGDSLLGTWLSCLRQAPHGHGRQRRTDSLPLFEDRPVADALRDVLPVRFSLALEPNDTPDQVRAKERALASLMRRDTALSRWKRVADLWCARWFAKESTILATTFATLSDAILTARCALPESTVQPLLSAAESVAAARRFFHWELEFPEIFFNAAGQRRSDGGFDAVIGNPPWDMVRSDPATSGGRPVLGDDSGIVRFSRDAGVYAAQSDGHANRYQLFLERSIALTRPGGRIGLVLPAGLAADHGSARLRRLLLTRCAVDGLVGFDNKHGIFPIHRSVRFLLLSATAGRATSRMGCRLGEVDPGVLERHGDGADQESWFPLRVTPALLEKLSGDDLTVPDLRTALDLTIAERAATLFQPLGSDSGWGVHFGRELNATEDRASFGPPGRGLPVVEGKLIEPFRAVLENARFSVSAREAARHLGDRHQRPRLAYRDVASATNRVTLIAAMLPAHSVSTHTVFCLRTSLALRAQHFLCGMFNSLVVNYLVRLRVSTHVTTSIVERLPIPTAEQAAVSFAEIAAIARALTRHDDRTLVARLNACVARLYALSDHEFEHVLGTFPLIPSEDRDATMSVFRRG